MLDYDLVDNLVFGGIDYSDYPDFCDSFISSAFYDGEPMTEEQLTELNEDRDFVYQKVIDHLF